MGRTAPDRKKQFKKENQLFKIKFPLLIIKIFKITAETQEEWGEGNHKLLTIFAAFSLCNQCFNLRKLFYMGLKEIILYSFYRSLL